MATKSAAAGSKRKSAPSFKAKPDSEVKKARLDEAKTRSRSQPQEDPEDDSDEVSDSEDGGAKLDNDASKKDKGNPAASGKTFERGLLHRHVPPLLND